MRRWKHFLLSLCATVLLIPYNVHANESLTNKGLFLSPPRHYITANAGEANENHITVANYTEAPLIVSLRVDEFSVADLSYEYEFRPVEQSWVTFEQTDFTLQPNENKKVAFSVHPPATAAPGGKYYVIIASAQTRAGDIISTVQVASPLYITVKGDINESNRLLDNHTITRFTTGDTIPFSLDIENTGNVHYPITVKASLEGLFTDKSSYRADHVLLPDTTRRLTGSIPVPLLPGVYKANYGYSSQATGNIVVSEYIVYLPLWTFIALFFVLWVCVLGLKFGLKLRRDHYSRPPKPTDSQR